MGYTSIMDGGGFTSKHTAAELTELYLDYLQRLNENPLNSAMVRSRMEYSFHKDECDKDEIPGVTDIWVDGIGETQKNYDTDELAYFIADHTTCAVRLWFTGEGGERWGYYIYPGRVYAERISRGQIEYHNPDVPLCSKEDPVEMA